MENMTYWMIACPACNQILPFEQAIGLGKSTFSVGFNKGRTGYLICPACGNTSMVDESEAEIRDGDAGAQLARVGWIVRTVVDAFLVGQDLQVNIAQHEGSPMGNAPTRGSLLNIDKPEAGLNGSYRVSQVETRWVETPSGNGNIIYYIRVGIERA